MTRTLISSKPLGFLISTPPVWVRQAWAWGAELCSLPSFASVLWLWKSHPDPLGLCFAISKMEGLGPESLRSFEPSCLSAFPGWALRKGRRWRAREGAGVGTLSCPTSVASHLLCSGRQGIPAGPHTCQVHIHFRPLWLFTQPGILLFQPCLPFTQAHGSFH